MNPAVLRRSARPGLFPALVSVLCSVVALAADAPLTLARPGPVDPRRDSALGHARVIVDRGLAPPVGKRFYTVCGLLDRRQPVSLHDYCTYLELRRAAGPRPLTDEEERYIERRCGGVGWSIVDPDAF
jgi:hypothetical protein